MVNRPITRPRQLSAVAATSMVMAVVFIAKNPSPNPPSAITVSGRLRDEPDRHQRDRPITQRAPDERASALSSAANPRGHHRTNHEPDARGRRQQAVGRHATVEHLPGEDRHERRLHEEELWHRDERDQPSRRRGGRVHTACRSADRS